MALVTNFENFFAEYAVAAPGDPIDVLECPVGKRYMILSLDISNIIDTGVQIDVLIYNSDNSSEYYLIKNAPVPVGSTLRVITGQKHILEEGDKIVVSANELGPLGAPSINIVGSLMDVYIL